MRYTIRSLLLLQLVCALAIGLYKWLGYGPEFFGFGPACPGAPPAGWVFSALAVGYLGMTVFAWRRGQLVRLLYSPEGALWWGAVLTSVAPLFRFTFVSGFGPYFRVSLYWFVAMDRLYLLRALTDYHPVPIAFGVIVATSVFVHVVWGAKTTRMLWRVLFVLLMAQRLATVLLMRRLFPGISFEECCLRIGINGIFILSLVSAILFGANAVTRLRLLYLVASVWALPALRPAIQTANGVSDNLFQALQHAGIGHWLGVVGVLVMLEGSVCCLLPRSYPRATARPTTPTTPPAE